MINEEKLYEAAVSPLLASAEAFELMGEQYVQHGVMTQLEFNDLQQDLNKLIEIRLEKNGDIKAAAFHKKIIEKFTAILEREKKKDGV